jgi:hypothetical protein
MWQPIGAELSRWGQVNRLTQPSAAKLLNLKSSASGGAGDFSAEETLVENVTKLACPSVFADTSEKLVLFSLFDPCKPWYGATDIGMLRWNGSSWVLSRLVDDQIAEFSPYIHRSDADKLLAAWTKISGDVSDANGPEDIVPHLEIVASHFDQTNGNWSTPVQLTSNTSVDRDPLPIQFGTTSGVLWIQNQADAAIGDINNPDRLMFARWSGLGWEEPQVLWSEPKGILKTTFVAGDDGEGYVVFAVDENGDPNSKTDRELYKISTVSGVWQTPVRWTNNAVEDSLPTLVAPNGIPICVWDCNDILTYTRMDVWNPKAIYSEYTISNEAASLDGVTMSGGAAVAYSVQGPEGVDIVASFYDASLDVWSLPRQLTNDEHAETALSLAYDGNELVIAYLKTQTERNDMDIEINGQVHHLENIPQPARTDLCMLRYTLGSDLAVVVEPNIIEPANPEPCSTATIYATIENKGDLPLQNVQFVLYDGNPQDGGVQIGNIQTITETLIAGTKQRIPVSWNVPSEPNSHQIFIIADPNLSIEDRDRSNNTISFWSVLPDLEIETCWSSEISNSNFALTARIINTGVVPANASQVSWRLGSVNGKEIGRSVIGSLDAECAHEVTYLWNAEDDICPGQRITVFAIADSGVNVLESDENNNSYSLAIFRRPVCYEGDLNCDGRVNYLDLYLFSQFWLEDECNEPAWCSGADLDHSSLVNMIDFSLLASYWMECSLPECLTGNLNSDCCVNLVDFSLLAKEWLGIDCANFASCYGADLNQDGEVDMLDIMILADHWLEGTSP